MACILTLRAHMPSWLAEWLSGQDTGTFFSEDTMRSWDQLHAGMPTESVSDVPSPSQDPAYLARLAGRADEGGHVVSPETAASPYSAFDTSEREIVAEAERAARRRARYPGLFEVVRDMSGPDIWGNAGSDEGGIYGGAELLQDVSALHPSSTPLLAMSWGPGSPGSTATTGTAWHHQPSPVAPSPNP